MTADASIIRAGSRLAVRAARDGFDPYTAWLHIESPDRPPNAYQLLGVRELESNRSVIRTAAERCRSELERHRASADERLWQRVAAEIDTAEQVLSQHERKAILDAAIRRRRRAERGTGDAARRLDVPSALGCAACGRSNSGRRQFCSDCGGALWRECPACQFECPAQETYCGGCGVNMPEAERQLVADAERALTEAACLYEAGRFQKAIRQVHQLATLEDPRLERIIQQAEQHYCQWRDAMDALRQAAVRSMERAASHLACGAFQAVLDELSSIPDELADEHVDALREQARKALQEIEHLDKDIKQSIASSQANGLGRKIERYLELKPGDEPMRRLASRLAKALEHSASRKLAEGQYARALELLDQAPHVARTNEHARLVERAEELSWLYDDLARATTCDETLVGVAERLARINPGDRQAVRWLATLRSMQADGITPVPWARSGGSSSFGPPLSCLRGWKRIDAGALQDRPELRQFPERWYVASGLALQGLGCARVAMNLAERKRGMLETLGFRRRVVRRAWGIDFGNAAFKAMELSLGENGQVVGTDFYFAEWPRPLGRCESDAERQRMVKETLREFLATHPIDAAANVCVGLPSQWTVTRTVRMPNVHEKRLREAVLFEAKQQFPMALEQLAWDHTLLAKEGSEHCHLILLAAKRELLATRQSELEACGLRVDIMQSGSLALYNLAAYECWWPAVEPGHEAQAPSDTREAATALLDLGGTASNLVIVAPDLVWCRTLPISGDNITAALVRRFSLTYGQAEQIKREPLRAARMSELYESIDRIVRELAGEVRRSLAVFEKDYGNYRIHQIQLTGGATRLHALLRLLQA